jgi:hypothetical protein
MPPRDELGGGGRRLAFDAFQRESNPHSPKNSPAPNQETEEKYRLAYRLAQTSLDFALRVGLIV